jgi:hypothetical protein
MERITELLRQAQEAEQERRTLIDRGEIKVAANAWRNASANLNRQISDPKPDKQQLPLGVALSYANLH